MDVSSWSRSLAARLIRPASVSLALFVVCLLPACGQREEEDTQEPAKDSRASSHPTPEIIQALFEANDEAAFQQALTTARAARLSEQAVLEARFLFLFEQDDRPALAALAPALVKQAASFQVEDSVIFSVQEEFASIAEFCLAIGALEADDPDAFKEHIKEAFWLSPRQAATFAPLIDQLRLEQAMARLQFDFSQRVVQQDDANAATLAELSDNAGHILLHFWSPWSTECEANLPDFLAMTAELQDNGIPVFSVLTESTEETVAAAEAFRTDLSDANNGTWIVDNSENPLQHQLRVMSLPTVALIAANGRVLFNGHPADEALWTELRSAVPAIRRPAAPAAPAGPLGPIAPPAP